LFVTLRYALPKDSSAWINNKRNGRGMEGEA